MLQALDGVRVLEVGADLSVHYAGRLLGEIGAEVLKVEPVAGDRSRRRGPFVGEAPNVEGSALFLYLNINKRGVTLDRSTPTGQEILAALAARADVVLWGADPAEGRALFDARGGRAAKLWLLASPFGATGPHAGWLAHGINLFHAGGEGYLMPGGATYEADPDREPIKGGGYLGEFSGGLAVAAGVLIGLLLAEERRSPLLVNVSLQEALLHLVRPEISQFADEDTLASRASRLLALGGLMPAADGWAEVMPLEQRMWEGLVAWMGEPAWAAAYVDDQARRDAVAAIGARVADWTRQRSREALYVEGQRHGVPVGPVLTVAEVLASAQHAARGFFVEIEHPYAGRLKYPALPFRFTPSDPVRYRPAPLLGQHNRDVYVGELGYSRRELDALFEAGII